jgi:hypothetical protein
MHENKKIAQKNLSNFYNFYFFTEAVFKNSSLHSLAQKPYNFPLTVAVSAMPPATGIPQMGSSFEENFNPTVSIPTGSAIVDAFVVSVVAFSSVAALLHAMKVETHKAHVSIFFIVQN